MQELEEKEIRKYDENRKRKEKERGVCYEKYRRWKGKERQAEEDGSHERRVMINEAVNGE